jgi:hypothetical protein
MTMMDRQDTNSEPISQQDRWNNIVEANKEAAEEVLGYTNTKMPQDLTIKRFSQQQKELGNHKNAEKDSEKRKILQRKRTKNSRSYMSRLLLRSMGESSIE